MKSGMFFLLFLSAVIIGCNKDKEAKPSQQTRVQLINELDQQPVSGAGVYFFRQGRNFLSLHSQQLTDSQGYFELFPEIQKQGYVAWFSHADYASGGFTALSGLSGKCYLKPYVPVWLSFEKEYPAGARVWGSFNEAAFIVPAGQQLDTLVYHHAPDTMTLYIQEYGRSDTVKKTMEIREKDQLLKIK
jgi:hypothetical protein